MHAPAIYHYGALFVTIGMLKHQYIRDYGGNGEVIILLHGFVSASEYWRSLQPKLSLGGYRVITIDLLGFGKAPQPADSDYSYEAHLKHIDQAVSYLGLTKPFLVIGHSMGALLAIRYGLVHNGKVRSLILLHPPLFKDGEEVRRTLRSTGQFYRILLESRHRNNLWVALQSIRLVGRHSRYARERSMVNVIEKAEMLNDLKKIRKDTLLIVGSKDRKEYLSNLENHRLSSRVSVVIEDIGHHSARHRPNLILKYFNYFVSKN